jgi:hypothetical protein
MRELYNAIVKERTIQEFVRIEKTMIHELGYSAYLCQTRQAGDDSSPKSIVKKSSFGVYAPMSQKWHEGVEVEERSVYHKNKGLRIV